MTCHFVISNSDYPVFLESWTVEADTKVTSTHTISTFSTFNDDQTTQLIQPTSSNELFSHRKLSHRRLGTVKLAAQWKSYRSIPQTQLKEQMQLYLTQMLTTYLVRYITLSPYLYKAQVINPMLH